MTYAERFQRLTALLTEWQPLWRPLPFHHRQMPWASRHSGLYRYLMLLDEANWIRLERDPFATSGIGTWLPVAELTELTQLPSRHAADESALPNRWGDHIGGRKWQQLEAFVHRVEAKPGQAMLEWCAGKGHLARTLSRLHGSEVTALEWQAELCEQGRQLAERQGVALKLIQQDVIAPDAGRWLDPQGHVVALHACGDLHTRLLQRAAETGCDITLAPCCYQRTAADHYRPLSQLGRRLAESHDLQLERDDLALAVQETVTASAAVSRQRERANAWRLGFDLLQRDVRDCDRYLPVPSLAYGRMPASFADFCRWAAQQKGLSLPESTNKGIEWEEWEAAGWRRLAEVQRLELVRHLFRRPLEVWLVLDRLMLLEEAGYRVRLGTFCERELTPRNLLIQATRP
ncbi:Methyltransferase domain-containing protein [Modicisalibacter muralis]|uniref:Methyltransferase domain-containing protein n=2 Tax=Modicisalibacter muralis TaxID=119000 RepID=A0A1G9M5H3_9GAMM|nr:Methyltransferase domain-containing protein [Halomonas muralis]